MEKEIKIHNISKNLYNNLSKLKNWEETKIIKNQAVKAHKHKFDAMYFTKGIKTLYSNGKKIKLPDFAAVYIPIGQEHGWSGTNKELGIVGHFHSGHGIHKIISEY